MVIDRRKAILFSSSAFLRLILFFALPSLPSLLTGRVEISTPVTSFKRCKSLYLSPSIEPRLTSLKYKKASSSTPIISPLTMVVFFTRQAPMAPKHDSLPYANHSSQAPLLLPLFALIPPSLFSPLTALLYILLDLLCANALIRIVESGESGSSRLFTSPRKDMKWDGVTVAAGYGCLIHR